MNDFYVDGKPVGTVTDIRVDGDFTDIERRAIDCADAEPQGATTSRRPYQALLAASAFLGASPFRHMFEQARQLDADRARAKILGKEATSAVVDELQSLGSAINRQMEFYAEMQLGDGWLWASHRTRNLSHRPVAGARKRKAALKHAAHQHRAVMREHRYV